MEPLALTVPADPPATRSALEPVTVIVPTYNESQNIPVLLERLAAAMAAVDRPFELLVVDDNSPDKTGEVANALGAAHPIRAIVRTEERGLATAVIRGIEEARYDLCVCMDADLSHPPETVPELCARIEAGAPFAIGSRYVEGGETVDWSFLRFLNSLGATLLARPLTRVRDPMSGFFAVRRRDVPIGDLNPVGYKIALEILVKARIPAPEEVPITFTDRLHGESKMTVGEQVRYLQHLGRLYRWRWPTATQLALFVAVGSVGMVVDFAVLSVAIELLGLWFGFARIPAFLAAVTTNFLLNDRITFEPSAAGRAVGPFGRYARFLLACSVGMLVNWAVSTGLYVSSPFFAQYYLLAAFLGAVAGTGVNFAGAKYFVFHETRPR